MQVRNVSIANVRSIESLNFQLGQVTLLVGKNNSGKSAIIRSLHAMQSEGEFRSSDIRHGRNQLSVTLGLDDVEMGRWPAPNNTGKTILTLGMDKQRESMVQRLDAGKGVAEDVTNSPISNAEPANFIYPFLSHRKVDFYEAQIDEVRSREVRSNLSNLASKVDRLMDPNHPRHDEFRALVAKVIGLPMSAIPSAGGKQVGMWVSDTEWIPLNAMGDGVGQMLGLIVQLVLARNKLFLIEELENDMHPEALKVMLHEIEARSTTNQFVLSAHSNVVVRHLGALPDTRIYSVNSTMREEGEYRLPTTTIELVDNEVGARTELLASLGYELTDFDLFDGWLILEESSAERIIRDHLVRWFAPSLSRVRAVAAQGAGDLDRSFNALEKLVLYTHLQERYRGRVWVIADGDAAGTDAIRKLTEKYTKWPGAFKNFSAHDFETYYPSSFAGRVQESLAIADKQSRRTAKRQLLAEVLQYIEMDDDVAKSAFAVSAEEVIRLLQEFETMLGSASKQISANAEAPVP